MWMKTRLTASLVLVGAVTVLAACSGGQSPLPSSQLVASGISVAEFAQAKTKGLLFISDPAKNTIEIFMEDSPSKPIGSISNGLATPGALTVDHRLNLYVANGHTNAIAVYAPPYNGAPTASYTSGLSGPTSLTVAPDGTLYVAEAIAGPLTGQIVVFPPHQTTPSRTIPLNFPFGVTTDSHGNLYVSPGTLSDVEKFAPGSSTGKLLGLRGLLAPAGLAVDAKDDLVVVDEGIGEKPAVYTFPPNAKLASSTITAGLVVPETIAVSSNGSHVFVGDTGSAGIPEQVRDFTYPAGAQTAAVARLSDSVAVSRYVR